MSMGMRERMAKMRMWMRSKKPRQLMMDQRRMWNTDGIVVLTWEPVMSTSISGRVSTSISAQMLTMWMRRRRNKHCKPMMDHRRMWRTEGIVRESVKI